MKRIGFLYEKIMDLDNLRAADAIARKGKSKQPGVIEHDKNRESNILALQQILQARAFRTSAYKTFMVHDPKEREVYRLPYFPDRILHHAIMNVLEPIFVSVFTTDTYSCIKGKGIHAAASAVKRALKDKESTLYCLKMDIRKFYPSVDHVILKQLLCRKFKDQDLLGLLYEIIDSAPGLPIGNYLSQYLANYYLAFFDHWIKEEKGVKYYFRYADDLVILSGDKSLLHQLRIDITQYLLQQLNLQVKDNYQVFPVAARGLDFVGYRFYHTHTLLRKTIKKNFARMLAKRPRLTSIASYNGWSKHCNSKNLLNKLIHGNEKIQRLQHIAQVARIQRAKNKDQQDPQQGDCSARLQD